MNYFKLQSTQKFGKVSIHKFITFDFVFKLISYLIEKSYTQIDFSRPYKKKNLTDFYHIIINRKPKLNVSNESVKRTPFFGHFN